MSRVDVQVVLRMSTSISPVWSAGARCGAFSGRNSTSVGSPRTAAATARQKSASKPLLSPVPSSRTLKPGRSPLTPQMSCPRSMTRARMPVGSGAGVGVGLASCAAAGTTISSAPAMASAREMLLKGALLRCRGPPPPARRRIAAGDGAKRYRGLSARSGARRRVRAHQPLADHASPSGNAYRRTDPGCISALYPGRSGRR